MNLKEKYNEWIGKHKNFMTPRILKTKVKGDSILELSQGEDFEHNKIYGVSVITYKDYKFNTNNDKGKVFWSKNKAEKYFNNLFTNEEMSLFLNGHTENKELRNFIKRGEEVTII